MVVVSVCLFLVGVAGVLATLGSVVRIFVLPRGERDRLGRLILLTVRLPFDALAQRLTTYEARDRVMALYAPVGLLVLLVAWLTLALLSYTAIFWALGVRPWQAAFTISGSSLLTLGFSTVQSFGQTVVAFTEAAVGLILIALLIAYLPTIYSAFSRREEAVTMLEVRAGSPPSAVEMIGRYHRLGRLERLAEVWATWEVWFAELQESHTSLAILAFFRSPQPGMSWVTAAGAVLDSGALLNAAVDVPHDTQTDLCLRAGYLAFNQIAAQFNLAYSDHPAPDDPISVNRFEFDEALAQLAAWGVPLRPDRDAAWRAFAGWRVNYDIALLSLATLTMAPFAPWSSDRGAVWRHPFKPRWRRPAPATARIADDTSANN